MSDNTTPFFKRKTTWAAIGSMATAVGGYMTGTVSAFEGLTLLFQGLMALGLRSALEKTVEEKPITSNDLLP